METNQKKTAPKAEDLAPQAPAAEPEQGVQSGPARYRVTFRFGLNLRDQAGKNGKIVKILPYGTEVASAGEPVQADNGFWLPVECGWVDMAYLNLATAGE